MPRPQVALAQHQRGPAQVPLYRATSPKARESAPKPFGGRGPLTNPPPSVHAAVLGKGHRVRPMRITADFAAYVPNDAAPPHIHCSNTLYGATTALVVLP